MINSGLPSLPGGRRGLLVLAFIGLFYLFRLGQPSTAHLSNWNAMAFFGNTAPSGLTGAALPQIGRGMPPGDIDTPYGNPLQRQNTVMTQGYGVGSHAPANIWGAIDLAIDGSGDGQADPAGTIGAPIYATHQGVVHVARNTYPAGNHIWVVGVHFKTGYSHLSDFAVQEGQIVGRGELIGYVGSTGASSGPHLDYQVWKDGVNVNPLDYGALEGTLP